MNELTIEGFIEFVKSKNADEVVENFDNGMGSYKNCAIGSYVKKTLEIDDEDWDNFYYRYCYDFNNLHIKYFDKVLLEKLGNCQFNTYGEIQKYLDNIKN